LISRLYNTKGVYEISILIVCLKGGDSGGHSGGTRLTWGIPSSRGRVKVENAFAGGKVIALPVYQKDPAR